MCSRMMFKADNIGSRAGELDIDVVSFNSDIQIRHTMFMRFMVAFLLGRTRVIHLDHLELILVGMHPHQKPVGLFRLIHHAAIAAVIEGGAQ